MASYYYEISEPLVKRWGGKYHVVHARTGDAMMAGGLSMTIESERIWREDSAGVRFIKNRYTLDFFDVDMEEFMWVKLSAKTLA